MNKEQQQLSETFASLKNELKELIAKKPEEGQPDKLDACMNAIYNMVANLHDRIDNSNRSNWNWQDNHIKASTHLPKLTASQTKAMLKACGADSDYNVEKPSIYARASRQGNTEFEVEIGKTK